ncbi:MAG: hypothetical protein HY755_09825 [Nitrospirae bacterium]|nr:hypothetical protein [Nitrospirota bacterium]
MTHLKIVDSYVVDIINESAVQKTEDKQYGVISKISFEESYQVVSPKTLQQSLEYPQEIKQPTKDSDSEADSLNSQIHNIQQAFTMNLNRQMAPVNIGFFYKNVRHAVTGLFHDSIPEQTMKAQSGKIASVKIIYSDDGSVENISITSENDSEFADMLRNKVQWHSVPLPSKYNLPYKGLTLKLNIKDGKPLVGIEVL